jgi:alcohol-forming fatty acyl-CoA reductase
MMRRRPTTWLLTGVTGFLGKVMLEELMRRREELALAQVYVLVRAKGEASATERFRRQVANAACFAALPPDWTDAVTVLDGDLVHAGLGLSARERAALDRVTHVVHSAASVSFDLPVQEAARANITTSLNLLDAMRDRAALERFVYVSTAYVTPHPGDGVPVPEALVPLKDSASTLLDAIGAGVPEATLLARTGHPNTYTFTKCLCEHLLVERRGRVRLSIVRPSVISAARALPFPGWIDSTAGFGAFATLIGLGHLRAIVGDPEARLDVVPVDEVSQRITHAALLDDEPVMIRHAVAGLARAPRVRECRDEVERWFRLHRTDRRPGVGFLGRKGLGFRLADLWHHRVPMALGALRSATHRRRARKLAARLDHLNTVFPYFTSQSFHFEASLPMGSSYQSRPYVATICRGIYRHLLRRDDREWALAGRAHPGHDGDLRWVMDQPRGNAWVRGASLLVTKVLRRTTDAVTVDLPSFERVRESLPRDAAIVLVPSHRSYLDFVLCSYLAFARPDLGLPIPHIAATMEFGRIPVLGRILAAMHAFYLRRGTGKEDPELTRRVHTLIASGRALEFFIEGARSRSREWLPPKRGLLRCLQATGTPCMIVPISISYDRVPEEASFARELAGEAKPPMRLGALLRWTWRAWRGRVALGRVHIAAGTPVRLDARTEVPEVAERIVDELRGAMAITSFHLEAYLAHHPIDGHDAASLRRLIEAKGIKVLDSALRPAPEISPEVARTYGAHFLDAVAPLAAARPRPAPTPLVLERAG